MSRACPICKQNVAPDNEHRPFCSGRCQDVDLGKWLNEEYKISRPVTWDDEISQLPRTDEERN